MAIEDGAVLTRALGMTETICRGAADLPAQPRRSYAGDWVTRPIRRRGEPAFQ